MTGSDPSNKISVCVLDYGSGNVRSVLNMIQSLGVHVHASNSERDIADASHLILPGVGSFANSVELVHKSLPIHFIHQQVLEQRKPFLGICVGMQILAQRGLEFGEHQGLGWIDGEVGRLACGTLPLPHVGWNDVEARANSQLFKGIPPHSDFYFVHSFAINGASSADVAAESDYGGKFVAAIERDNLCGVQFHPEKSQKAGKLLLANFLSM